MDAERNGGPRVDIQVPADPEETESALQPHYDDEELNIYETIPLDESDENCLNYQLKKKGKSPSCEHLDAANANQPSTSRRVSNEYVTTADLYSTPTWIVQFIFSHSKLVNFQTLIYMVFWQVMYI